MKSNFTFKHLDYSQSLVQYATDKLNEIGHFLLKDGRSNVYFSKDHHEFCVEVSVNTKQKFFKASAVAPDAYVAVDLMVDKLEKQFIKVKEVYMDHKKYELSKEGRLQELNSKFEYHPKWKKAAS